MKDTLGFTCWGYRYLVKGKLAKAKKYGRKALEIEPYNPIAHELLAEIHKDEADLDKAVVSHNSAILGSEMYNSRLYRGRADARASLGDLEGAIADYSRAIEVLENISEEAGDLDAAIPDCHKNKLDFDNAKSYACRGWIRMVTENYEEADSDFRQATNLRLNSARVYYTMGILKILQGDIDSALIYFKRSIELYGTDDSDPFDPEKKAFVDAQGLYDDLRSLDEKGRKEITPKVKEEFQAVIREKYFSGEGAKELGRS